MYRFNATECAFYSHELMDDYINAGTWPEEGVDVDNETRAEYLMPQDGFVVGSDRKGHPKWVTAPPTSKEQLIEEAEQQKLSLLAEANEAIAPLQDAVELGMATDKEVELLKAWKLYRIQLNRIDTSLAADIDWGIKPE